MYQILFESPVLFILFILSLILCLSIHEFAHAYAADRLGDSTAKYLGRLTLNPLAHLDPVGTLLLVFAGFGWGKPVPVDSTYFKNPKRDMPTSIWASFAIVVLMYVYTRQVVYYSLANNDTTNKFRCNW